MVPPRACAEPQTLMSRKQAARSRSGGPKKARRPRQAAGGAAAKPSEGGGGGLARQLRALGLKLREVPGDGNCLFRALGDQLEGHSRNHLRHRQETVEYMIKRREDFEPFVEDDVPFEKHVTNLAKPGTFAGNDAIVAFARNNQMNVVIHQLNAPLWQIQGTDKSDVRELHIAYRHGEHYDSVRRINDDSESPAYLRMEMLPKNESNKEEETKQQKDDSEDETEIEMEAAVQKVCSATGCSDIELVSQVLKTEDYNLESAIFAIFQVQEVKRISAEEQSDPQSNGQELCASALCEENGSGSGILGSQSLHRRETEDKLKGQARSDEESRANKNVKVFKKQKKEQQRLEKKKRQEERHRQKVLANRSNSADNSKKEVDSDNQITLVKTMAALNI
ncbi:OTU domain-containing protein 3 [Coturnix japonica]|uniref:OTU domain-containing protein 3 n=1 Tax=Coturnix japonica TaxID=93934 RepID=UPI000777A89E|nr:OTU domain-containing protein 3 [Coturnix japonica]XP_015737791.1 OTU domain-containing protein 3 [Coturnix japonica]